MIFCLYTLFSVFIGVVFITLSESFYVGSGSFFAFFLSSICIHMGWIGRVVILKIINSLKSNDSNKNKILEDIQNVQDSTNNLTEVVTSIINDNATLQQFVFDIQEKYDSQFDHHNVAIDKYNNQIFELKNKIQILESENTHLQNSLDLMMARQSLDYSSQQESSKEFSNFKGYNSETIPLPISNIDIRSVNQGKSIYDVSQKSSNESSFTEDEFEEVTRTIFNNDSREANKPNAIPKTEAKSIFSDDDFLNDFDPDDSFADLSFPPKVDIPKTNFNINNTPLTNSSNSDYNHNNDDDSAFVTIDSKTAETYGHLLNDTQDESFLDTIDEFQTKNIREQLSNQINQSEFDSKILNPTASSTSVIPNNYSHNQEHKNNHLEDEFIDVTHDIAKIDKQKTTIQNIHNPASTQNIPIKSELKTQEFNSVQNTNTKNTLPSLTELVPDEKLRNIAHRQSILKRPQNIPSLETLLKPKSVSQYKNDNFNDEFIDTDNISSITQSISNNKINNLDKSKTIIHTIHQALENEKIDLFIQPITDNQSREVKYFEAYYYLIDDNGNYLLPEKFIPLARQESLESQLDNLVLIRTVSTLKYITNSIKDAAIFCNISIQSIDTPHFESQLQNLIQQGVAKHIILEFSQEQLELLNAVRIEKLLQLKATGIRFSLDNIHDILPNLSELSDIGISFIKIRPDDFIYGIQSNGKTYKGNSIKKALSDAHISLCVSQINNHEELLRSVENQADLLQGDLLGEKERSELLEAYAV